MIYPDVWEYVIRNDGDDLKRLRVPGGWLVAYDNINEVGGLVFLADPRWDWSVA